MPRIQLIRPKFLSKICAKTIAVAADRGDERDEQRHPPEVRQLQQRVIQQVREAQRENQLRDRGDQEDAERVDGGVPEPRVTEESLEVREADEGLLADRVPVEEHT